MNALTLVEITFYPEVINDWLRFGDPEAERIIDRRRSLAAFAPGSVFAYVRWHANDYGTADWRLYVLRAGGSDDMLDRVPGVRPGAEILCGLSGKAKVKRALDLIDDLEARGFNPAAISPAWWRVTGNRISVGLPVRPYGEYQHDALAKIARVWS
ncbi:DUF2840 domain-containing protein [Parasphingopyxis algicola]|uniref:DUF2840 domain-containing protein n=1 Tax=Parasphingopyxis algicola TaxID=2026624 RepID=UPI0015A38E19|nr:DUF2840 domain-containing protein [Parasphingopyxis algicola]QLC24877.1 DUF2840 domain-containing protein [Parasphingopyxis algicola]